MTSPEIVVKDLYGALGRGDVPALLALLAPELAWTEAEGFPYSSGTWRSPEEVLTKLLIPLQRDWDDFTVSSEETVSAGDTVVSFGAYAGTAKATGKRMRAPFAHRWQVHGGKIVRFDMYTDTLLVHRAMT